MNLCGTGGFRTDAFEPDDSNTQVIFTVVINDVGSRTRKPHLGRNDEIYRQTLHHASRTVWVTRTIAFHPLRLVYVVQEFMGCDSAHQKIAYNFVVNPRELDAVVVVDIQLALESRPAIIFTASQSTRSIPNGAHAERDGQCAFQIVIDPPIRHPELLSEFFCIN